MKFYWIGYMLTTGEIAPSSKMGWLSPPYFDDAIVELSYTDAVNAFDNRRRLYTDPTEGCFFVVESDL